MDGRKIERRPAPRISDEKRERWRAQVRDIIRQGKRPPAELLRSSEQEDDDRSYEIRGGGPLQLAAPSSTDEQDEAIIQGQLVPFDQRSVDLGWGYEQFTQTAFDKDWSNIDDAMGLWRHDRTAPLASVRGGTLELTRTRSGVQYKMRPPALGIGQYVAELVRRGDVQHASIGFILLEDRWDLDEQDVPLRTVIRAVLVEASVVFWPAYRQTSASFSQKRSASPRFAVTHSGSAARRKRSLELERMWLELQRKRLELQRKRLEWI